MASHGVVSSGVDQMGRPTASQSSSAQQIPLPNRVKQQQQQMPPPPHQQQMPQQQQQRPRLPPPSKASRAIYTVVVALTSCFVALSC